MSQPQNPLIIRREDYLYIDTSSVRTPLQSKFSVESDLFLLSSQEQSNYGKKILHKDDVKDDRVTFCDMSARALFSNFDNKVITGKGVYRLEYIEINPNLRMEQNITATQVENKTILFDVFEEEHQECCICLEKKNETLNSKCCKRGIICVDCYKEYKKKHECPLCKQYFSEVEYWGFEEHIINKEKRCSQISLRRVRQMFDRKIDISIYSETREDDEGEEYEEIISERAYVFVEMKKLV